MDHKDKSREWVSDFVSGKSDSGTLEKEIAKYASSQNLSNHMIEYMVGLTNKGIIQELYKEVPNGTVDPHFVFEHVKTASIVEKMKSPMRKSASARLPQKPSLGIVKMVDSYNRIDMTMVKSASHYVDHIDDLPTKDIAIRSLRLAKEELEHAKSDYFGHEGAIKMASTSLINMISRELVSGTPINVVESLDNFDVAKNNFFVKRASAVSIEDDFELDESSDIVRQDRLLTALKSKTESLKNNIDKAQLKVANLQARVKSWV